MVRMVPAEGMPRFRSLKHCKRSIGQRASFLDAQPWRADTRCATPSGSIRPPADGVGTGREATRPKDAVAGWVGLLSARTRFSVGVMLLVRLGSSTTGSMRCEHFCNVDRPSAPLSHVWGHGGVNDHTRSQSFGDVSIRHRVDAGLNHPTPRGVTRAQPLSWNHAAHPVVASHQEL